MVGVLGAECCVRRLSRPVAKSTQCSASILERIATSSTTVGEPISTGEVTPVTVDDVEDDDPRRLILSSTLRTTLHQAPLSRLPAAVRRARGLAAASPPSEDRSESHDGASLAAELPFEASRSGGTGESSWRKLCSRRTQSSSTRTLSSKHDTTRYRRLTKADCQMVHDHARAVDDSTSTSPPLPDRQLLGGHVLSDCS